MDHLWDMSIVPLGDDNIAIQSKPKERERANRPATASTGTSQSSTVPEKTNQPIPANVKTGQSVSESSLNRMTASAAAKTSTEQPKTPSSSSRKPKILNVSSAETTKPAVDRATTQPPTTLAGVSSKKTLPGITQARSQDTLKERNVPVFQPSSSRKRTICQTLETQASPHTSSSRSQEKKLKTTHNTTTTNIKEEHQDQLIKSSNPIAPKPRRPRPSSTHLFPITKKKGNARTKEGSKEAVDKSPMADAQVYDRIVEFIIVEI